jgi:acyl-CoA synthetase (AMP-forming)/AMP-acid ligase II
MTAASVTVTAVRALLRSGLLGPPGPAAVYRLLREAHRGGTNPYTLLAVAAARSPDRAAIIDDDGILSYRELQSETEALARQLSRDGVRPGQAVGILCRNGRSFVEGLFAAALVGADVVLVNTDFRTDALAAALSAHQIEAMVAEQEFADRLQAADRSVTVIDPAAVTASEDDSRPKVAAAGRIVLLTSGTTGKPKGVPRTPHMRSVIGVWVTILDRTGLRTGSRFQWQCRCFTG